MIISLNCVLLFNLDSVILNCVLLFNLDSVNYLRILIIINRIITLSIIIICAEFYFMIIFFHLVCLINYLLNCILLFIILIFVIKIFILLSIYLLFNMVHINYLRILIIISRMIILLNNFMLFNFAH